MDKEKEFDELKLLLSSEFPITTDIIARKIIELGYRKADEVRKETAKEILQEVRQNAGGRWLAELCEKYGVEVDE